jgi:hypothetical protein
MRKTIGIVLAVMLGAGLACRAAARPKEQPGEVVELKSLPIIPFAIRVVLPFYLNDLSSGRLLGNCLLDRGRRQNERKRVGLRGRSEREVSEKAYRSSKIIRVANTGDGFSKN